VFVYLFVSYLTKHSVASLDYITSNGWMMMNDNLERILNRRWPNRGKIPAYAWRVWGKPRWPMFCLSTSWIPCHYARPIFVFVWQHWVGTPSLAEMSGRRFTWFLGIKTFIPGLDICKMQEKSSTWSLRLNIIRYLNHFESSKPIKRFDIEFHID
jgi:hypothetical protein